MAMQLTKTIAVLLALPPLFFAAGCSAPAGGFPSLAKRPFELAQPAGPVEEPVTAPAILPREMEMRLGGLMDRHRSAIGEFDRNLPGVQEKVAAAAGASVGDEAWVVAQMHLSRLDKIRDRSLEILGDVDLLAVAAQDAESAGQGERISALVMPYQEQVANDVARQNAEIEALAAMLPQ